MTTANGLRVALAGGGTGGHVHPGLHLLTAPAARGVADVVWFQAGRGVEDRAFRTTPLPIEVERVVLSLEPEGGGAPSLARLAAHTPPAVRTARRALARHGSEVLLGLGGFTCLPAVLAARSLRLPVALLEINAAPGKATRVLAPLASRVLHAWPTESTGRRHVVTGPPLAPVFAAGPPGPGAAAEARRAEGFDPDAPLLVVLGGSQGARGLNRFVSHSVDLLARRGVGVLHQVGPGRLHEAAFERPGYRAVEYVEDVPRVLAAATVVLCRGGASTLAEVGALRRPAWVVPYPHHRDRHQELNARRLGEGVRIVAEEELNERLGRELARLAGPAGEAERRSMAHAQGGAVPLDGALRIWGELIALARPETARRA